MIFPSKVTAQHSSLLAFVLQIQQYKCGVALFVPLSPPLANIFLRLITASGRTPTEAIGDASRTSQLEGL